ncbi:MAG: CPBP family intramembrane metalloprotease [Bacteroidetes bacterium]|jgi:hypothetical protein|nr:CPBP family intramembrane metalloprotease [Bacteroidota bacterium]
MRFNKGVFLLLALATLLGMGGAGLWLIPVSRDVTIQYFVTGLLPLYQQVIVGIVAGLFISFIAWFIISLPFFTREREYYTGLIKPFQLTIIEIFFVAVCAGVGEELLFRGGIQPFLGIWPTSIVFVLLHGYINPAKPALNVYGIFMILSIALLGYLTENIGILSSITAHTIIDIILLYKLTHS